MTDLKQKPILLVDDEVLIGMATKNNLSRFGYTVVTATRGDQAIEFVQQCPDCGLVLMDIDLGREMNGIDASREILKSQEMPIVFVSSHTEPEIVSLTEAVTSYGYIVKSSSPTVYDASIKMAYKLFTQKRQTEAFDRYLKTALANASEPIFISEGNGNVVYYNKAFLEIQGLSHEDAVITELAEFPKTTTVFSDTGQRLSVDNWASTRPLRGESGENVVFYVYNHSIKTVLINEYPYAPIFDDHRRIIGSYVKIGKPVANPDLEVLASIERAIGEQME